MFSEPDFPSYYSQIDRVIGEKLILRLVIWSMTG
jgi:hypothetical protein